MNVNHDRPFSQACEQNQHIILAVLKDYLVEPQWVFEIGSGTGQHAVFFARELPFLHWQPSDLSENLPGISAWIEYSGLDNISHPITLDVASTNWPEISAGCFFSANSLHIMSWNHVIAFFGGLARVAEPNAHLIVYGPFNYNNEFTSESNREFDAYLRSRDPLSGVRNFDDIDELANAAGFTLLEDRAMPANNRTLVWKKAG